MIFNNNIINDIGVSSSGECITPCANALVVHFETLVGWNYYQTFQPSQISWSRFGIISPSFSLPTQSIRIAVIHIFDQPLEYYYSYSSIIDFQKMDSIAFRIETLLRFVNSIIGCCYFSTWERFISVFCRCRPFLL